jgi:hypothetical protein
MAPNRYDRQQVDRMDVDMLYYPQVLCLLFQIVIHFVFSIGFIGCIMYYSTN